MIPMDQQRSNSCAPACIPSCASPASPSPTYWRPDPRQHIAFADVVSSGGTPGPSPMPSSFTSRSRWCAPNVPVKSLCCSSRSCVRCGGFRIRICATGYVPGPIWLWHVACHWARMAFLASLVPLNNGSAEIALERRFAPAAHQRVLAHVWEGLW